jgi:class 3 adenylate cyclase/tetratricopeptide (TPR) repeat protein
MSSIRSIATVLFTDIVGSTERAMALGDRRWRDVLGRHNEVVRARIARYGGQEITNAGDGFLALFDGPTPALLCAASIRDALDELELEIRAGIHMGEIQREAEGASGVSIHIGSRVAGLAAPGEILVSSTVRDAETGSDFTFEDRGRHPLKGVPGEWRVYALAGLPDDADAVLPPAQERAAGLADRLPRGRPALLAGMAGALLLAAGIGYLALRDGPSPDAALAESAGPGIAILPFDVRGAEHGSMREGMVDLLSTNLDGAGGLRAIDSRTVLAEWRERVTGDETPALATALQVASATGARYAIVGNVIPIGDDMRVLVDVHDLETGQQLGSEQVEGSPDSIFGLVDDLSIRLLTLILQDEDGLPQIELAGITTHSLPALKAFLEGEAFYRRSDFDRAIPAYEEAVETDSTFALAYRRLSAAHGWVAGGDSPLVTEYLELASRYAERLPPRDAEFLEISLAIARSHPIATELARTATQRYPDDPEAWDLLGEVYHHLRNQSLAGRKETDDAFLRAARLDPSYAPAYIHPLDNAFFHADSARASQLLPVLQRYAAGSAYINRYRLSMQVAFGDSSTRAAALNVLDTVPAEDVEVVTRNTAHPRFLDLQAEVIEASKRNPDVPEEEVVFRQADNSLLRGRIREGTGLLAGPGLDPEERFDTLEYAYMLGVPLPDSIYEKAFTLQPGDTVASEAGWFAALYALEQGRMNEFRRLHGLATREISGLEARGDSTFARLVRLGGAALEGRALMLSGDDTGARQAIEPVFREAGFPPLALWMAEILAEMGEEEEAIRYLETFGPDPWVARRLAPLYEKVEDREKALDAYSWMVLAWDEADAEVRPLYRQARADLARVQGLRRE